MSFLPLKPRLLACAGAGSLLLLAAFILPALKPASNCGRNSAALSACRSAVLAFRLVALDRSDERAALSGMTPSERENFRQVAGLNWLHGARILVSPAAIGLRGRDLVAVCDRPYDNVPQRWFGKAPMTHAAAYSDESTALLTVEEFKRLDLRGFVEVRSIPDPKSPPAQTQPSSTP